MEGKNIRDLENDRNILRGGHERVGELVALVSSQATVSVTLSCPFDIGHGESIYTVHMQPIRTFFPLDTLSAYFPKT